VLEDDDGRVVGISAIAGAVGLREPWYNFRVGLTVSASQELNIYREIPTLFLANDLTGNSELCSLFLHADYRSGLNGRMLSKARMLFIAEFPQLFGNKIIAEMRGVSDEAGRSPFWESLGRHFFKMEFSQADYLTGVGNKAFIAELMPKFPLYTCFLSGGAQRDRSGASGHRAGAGDAQERRFQLSGLRRHLRRRPGHRVRNRQDPCGARQPGPGAGHRHAG
jgi:arginine N-succinyltransferase